MIYKLRKKFIGISVAAVIAVFLAVFIVATTASLKQLNTSADTMADILSQNDGGFPENFEFPEREKPPERALPGPQAAFSAPSSGFMTPESRFTTRFFVVKYDSSGNITQYITDQISSVTQSDAKAYADKAAAGRNDRGWISDFRYKKYEANNEQCIIFIDSTANRTMALKFISSLAAVLAITALVITFLLILISKKAIKPIAESYDKQKRFITDASHELKTPLTVIMTNLDIIEADTGKSEWIDDIRTEGNNMTELVNHLVNLSRMDESNLALMNITSFCLSDVCNGIVEKFALSAGEKNLTLSADIAPGIQYKGDEKLISQLVSIFMDNAIKYCDAGGSIEFTLKNDKHPVIETSNTYADIDSLELSKLKDRFYRADKARTSGTGYGIGLSLADSIVSLHKGKIKIYKASDDRIGFRISL